MLTTTTTNATTMIITRMRIAIIITTSASTIIRLQQDRSFGGVLVAPLIVLQWKENNVKGALCA